MSQETINKLLIRGARRGKHVVRLKCGDPFVFGRGGEEALALARAGIPFEVVPGVSSAIAAPALAGIPVTHRGLASAVVVVSGHADAAWIPVVDGLATHGVTLVVLDGRLDAPASRGAPDRPGLAGLDARGAALRRGNARRVDVDRLAGESWPPTRRCAIDESHEGPGTIVIGEVVALAHSLARWRRRQSAAG